MQHTPPCAIPLPNRAVITAHGPDALPFLQRILTQNMEKLDSQPLIYAALLNAQGKFLHDMFIHQPAPDTYVMECEGGARAQALLKSLTLYRLRASVDFTLNDTVPVWGILDSEDGLPDPRHVSLRRSYQPIADLPPLPFTLYDRARIALGLPDGSRDAVIGQSTLAELGIEDCATDFTKGCYIGQELTARIHHRGLLKRSLIALTFTDTPPAFGTDIIGANGAILGDMRSSTCNIGLACLKIDAVDQLPPTIRRLQG